MYFEVTFYLEVGLFGYNLAAVAVQLLSIIAGLSVGCLQSWRGTSEAPWLRYRGFLVNHRFASSRA